MSKRLLFSLICALIISVHSMAQKVLYKDSIYSPRLVVGSSLTYIWDPDFSQMQEYTWSTNVSVSPIKRLYVGLNYLSIWNSSNITPQRHFHLFGVFSQYHLGNKRIIYFTPELGFYRGNYCTCGQNVPHRRLGINYIAVGGGFGIKLYKGLELDLSFLVYRPLLPNSGLDFAYGYTQYVIGLNYEFRLKRKAKSNKTESFTELRKAQQPLLSRF